MSFLSVYYVCFCLASLVFCFVLVFLFDRVFITVFGQNQNWSKHGCRLTRVRWFFSRVGNTVRFNFLVIFDCFEICFDRRVVLLLTFCLIFAIF